MTKQTVGKAIEDVIAKRSQYQAASGYLGMHTIANTSGTNPAITANTIKLSLRALFISIIRSDCETWKNGLKNPCGDGVSMFYTFELFLQYYLPYFLHLGRQDNSQCYSILILLIPRLFFQSSQVYFLVLFAFHHFAHDKASYLLYAEIVKYGKTG